MRLCDERPNRRNKAAFPNSLGGAFIRHFTLHSAHATCHEITSLANAFRYWKLRLASHSTVKNCNFFSFLWQSYTADKILPIILVRVVKEKAIISELTKQKPFLTWKRNREKIIPPIVWSNIAGIKNFVVFNQNSHSKSVTSCKQIKTTVNQRALVNQSEHAVFQTSQKRGGTHVFSRIWCKATWVFVAVLCIALVYHVDLAGGL